MSVTLGERFGRWTVVGTVQRRSNGRSYVACRCDCGTEREVIVQGLRHKNHPSRSCGCLKREQVATLVTRTRWKGSHGYAAGEMHPLYCTWAKVKERCYNPRAASYPWYGARGIGMCEAWRDDAGAFIDWIEANLGQRPEGHTLDRIDPDRGYEPDNLRWATHSEQRRNRSNVRRAA